MQVKVDREWRLEIRRHHTSVHLLQYSLREIVGPDVVQAGSWVGPERMRFDFRSSGGALSAAQRAEVSQCINRIIRDDSPVETFELPIEEARKRGALAMAGESYGEVVRVLQAGPSLELCGGTHAHRTGELGLFVLLSESSIGSGIRRIEGLVSQAAERFVIQQQQQLAALSAQLVVRPEEVVERVHRLGQELRERERELAEVRQRNANMQARDLASQAETIGPFQYIAVYLEDAATESLKELANALASRLQPEPYVLVLMGSDQGRLALLVVANQAAVQQGAHAGNLLRSIVPLVGGKGGGSATQAQGGGSISAGVAEAMQAAHGALRAMVQ